MSKAQLVITAVMLEGSSAVRQPVGALFSQQLDGRVTQLAVKPSK